MRAFFRNTDFEFYLLLALGAACHSETSLKNLLIVALAFLSACRGERR